MAKCGSLDDAQARMTRARMNFEEQQVRAAGVDNKAMGVSNGSTTAPSTSSSD